MRPKRTRPRSTAIVLAAAAASLALTASAGAAIYVYANGFATKAEFKEISKAGGGKKCDKSWREGSTSMGVTVVGKRLCSYAPPVVGDAAQPNHVIWARGQVLPKKTPKALREAAYLALKVRAGRGDFYELQVRPKGRRWKLLRNPSSNAVSEEGRSDAIKPLKNLNALSLMVKGPRVTAKVNGKKLVTVEDPNPDQVEGRKVTFGIGCRKDASRAVVGVFERVKVGIAD